MGKIYDFSTAFVWFCYMKQNKRKEKKQVVFTQSGKIGRTSEVFNECYAKCKHKETGINTVNIFVGE